MEMRQMTKIILAHELLEHGISQTQVAVRLGISRRTVIRWAQAIRANGSLEVFLEHYQRAKSGPRKKRKRDQILKQRIWALREKYHQCCGQKPQYFLEQDYGMQVSVTTIYQVLAEKCQLRSRGQRNQPRGSVPQAQAARQVVQMDTVVLGDVFAFTAIDVFSKESAVLLRPSLEAADGQAFLHFCMPLRFNGFVDLIQTDGGHEFKGQFLQDLNLYCARHRVARPYKKNEQSFIESFNRSLRRECLGWAKYRVAEIPKLSTWVDEWLQYYHYQRPHLSLGLRPPLLK
jgi:transcriptional regulator with XRE-family HTH domain